MAIFYIFGVYLYHKFWCFLNFKNIRYLLIDLIIVESGFYYTFGCLLFIAIIYKVLLVFQFRYGLA